MILSRLFLTLCILSGFSLSASAQQQNQQQGRPGQQKMMTRSNEKIGYLYSTAYRNEVEASATYGELGSAKSTTTLGASAEYKYLFQKAMQIGALINLVVHNGGGSNNTYTGLWGTFTYNFNQSWNVSDSYFGEIGVGMVDTVLDTSATITGNSEKKFSYFLYGGKRFPLFDKISYIPKAGIRKIGDNDMAFVIIPLNLAIAW